MGKRKPPPLSAKQLAQAARIDEIRHGAKPKQIVDPDGYGMTYISQDPHIQCPYCTAAFHDEHTSALHHEMQHPLERQPDHVRNFYDRNV